MHGLRKEGCKGCCLYGDGKLGVALLRTDRGGRLLMRSYLLRPSYAGPQQALEQPRSQSMVPPT